MFFAVIANGYFRKMKVDRFRDKVIADTREVNKEERQAKRQRLIDANKRAREYLEMCQAITVVVD